MHHTPDPPQTRAEVLRRMEAYRRALQHLRSHAGRVTEPVSPAHAEAIRRAEGEVRRVVAPREEAA